MCKLSIHIKIVVFGPTIFGFSIYEYQCDRSSTTVNVSEYISGLPNLMCSGAFICAVHIVAF